MTMCPLIQMWLSDVTTYNNSMSTMTQKSQQQKTPSIVDLFHHLSLRVVTMEGELTLSNDALLNTSAGTALVFVITTVFLLLRLKRMQNAGSTTTTTTTMKPACTLAVLGSGGHTTEMIRLLSSLNKDNYQPLYYIVADTDTTSVKRLNNVYEEATNRMKKEENNKNASGPPNHEIIFKIPRAREVGQSYISSLFSTIKSILASAHIVLWNTKPDVLIINGPGTCIPIAFWTFIGRLLGICEGKIIFCESFCRVTSLSLTGKILVKLRMVDLFLVHWQELMDVIDENYSPVKLKSDIRFVLIDSFIKHNE